MTKKNGSFLGLGSVTTKGQTQTNHNNDLQTLESLKKEVRKRGVPLEKLQFGFDEKALENLDFLVERLGADSRAVAVREAIRLYRWILENHDAGYRLELITPDEEYFPNPDGLAGVPVRKRR